ncbi:2Fe-2S iron-sulfur cluster binding domain-containing protein [Variovorax paradoxus]|uniref:2Fe-2S iron-sulfur cluster binding domain-containing protein n=2 Tax=Variovorax paradoxus TaxID=34073 RepID=A0A6I6H6G3_VARPD|nr:2Fe-2S iron-sulfur cluster binding domain-containing protein [Variovorax paradoxus]
MSRPPSTGMNGDTFSDRYLRSMFKPSSAFVFANFMQLPTVVPKPVWRALRVVSILSALALATVLALRPTVGMPLFWGLIVPSLPLVFMLAPGLWRNICPLAAINQLPRRFGITRALTSRRLSHGAAFPIGIGLLISAVVARKLLFNSSGAATAGLMAAAMGAAFIGGLLFKGKSGWCSSICPLLPVQRLYGQTPFIRIANTHCEPCVGCTKNCYDLNPGAAYLADQYDPDPAYRNFRSFFAGVFPGLILGYYLVPSPGEIGSVSTVMQMLLYMAASLTLFNVIEMLASKTRNVSPVLFAATAFSLYYWFTTPVIVGTLSSLGKVAIGPEVIGVLRGLTIIASLVWIARSLHVERMFLRRELRKAVKDGARLAPIVIETMRLNRSLFEPVRKAMVSPQPENPAGAVEPADSAAQAPELCIDPTGMKTPIRKGQTLLEAMEDCGAPINAGCRSGVCGADPIAVIAGGGRLAPIGSDERATLARLGCSDGTRLACMARVRNPGPIRIDLKPNANRTAPEVREPEVMSFDPSIRRVAIVGNGVAGLTAADHVRRRHPECEIHLIGRENHNAYNRMAIAKLISMPAGIQGLHLLPEQWYAEHRVTAWLNTHVSSIDTQRQELTLATRQTLGYDRLILCSGSSAWVPPMDGYGIDGSFVLRDADDAMAIRDYMQRFQGTSAVVLGAGLLGLEAAQALAQLGTQVQVLSNTSQILDRQIDAAASALLEAHLATQGISVITEAEVGTLDRGSRGRVAGVTLKDGRRLPADVVVVCTGVRANVDIAHSAGLALGRGIIVDAQMRTSDPHVYAAGDVAEFEGNSIFLWAVAAEQGEIAAINALGGKRVYGGHVPVTALKVSGIDVRSAGAVHATQPGDFELTQFDEAQGAYRKLVVARGRLVGAVLVGSPDEADEIIPAVRDGAAVSSMTALLERGHWRQHSLPMAA